MSKVDDGIDDPKEYFELHLRVLSGELVDLPLSVVKDILDNGIENLRAQGYHHLSEKLENRADLIFNGSDNIDEEAPISTIHAKFAIEDIEDKVHP